MGYPISFEPLDLLGPFSVEHLGLMVRLSCFDFLVGGVLLFSRGPRARKTYVRARN